MSTTSEGAGDRNPYLELVGVSRRYGGNTALSDLTLRAEEGEILALLGPSGCGKSTTLNLIAGFLAPDAGRILLQGRDLTRVPVRKRGIGVVFQNYSLFPHLSVAANVAYGLQQRRTPKHEIAQIVADRLRLVGLADGGDRYPDQLSGGQQQRVAIARALAINPPLLLLDEPLSNLDAKLRVEMRDEIKRLVKHEGITTVFVTHDQEEAFSVADRIAVMRDGRLDQLDTPEALYAEPASLHVARFLGRSATLAAVVTRVDGERVEARTSGGHVVHGAAAGSEMSVGDAVIAFIRPEHIRIHEASSPLDAPNVFEARLHSQTFLGQDVEYAFGLDGGVRLQHEPISWLSVGGDYRLEWPAEAVRMFRVDSTSASGVH